jgi:hypothetical protein
MFLTALFFVAIAVNFWLAWDTLLYWPIEISHTLKATRYNLFFNCAIVLSFPWILEPIFPELWMRIWVMFGVLLLGYDDHRFPVHQLAIYHLLAIFVGSMFYYCGWKTTLAYCVFYVLRGLSKVYLVSALLMHKPVADWIRNPRNTFSQSYKYITQPKALGHPVLRLGAIWQWLCWALAIYILENYKKNFISTLGAP